MTHHATRPAPQFPSLPCWPRAASGYRCTATAAPLGPTCTCLTWQKLLTSSCTRRAFAVGGRCAQPAGHAALHAPALASPAASRGRLAACSTQPCYDCLAALFNLQGTTGEVYNIGSQRERTVVEVAADICRLFGLDPQQQVRGVLAGKLSSPQQGSGVSSVSETQGGSARFLKRRGVSSASKLDPSLGDPQPRCCERVDTAAAAAAAAWQPALLPCTNSRALSAPLQIKHVRDRAFQDKRCGIVLNLPNNGPR